MFQCFLDFPGNPKDAVGLFAWGVGSSLSRISWGSNLGSMRGSRGSHGGCPSTLKQKQVGSYLVFVHLCRCYTILLAFCMLLYGYVRVKIFKNDFVWTFDVFSPLLRFCFYYFADFLLLSRGCLRKANRNMLGQEQTSKAVGSTFEVKKALLVTRARARARARVCVCVCV